MRKRIFIAINLPEGIKRVLADYQQKWPDLPARWTKPDNLHITTVFIGDIEEQSLIDIEQVVSEVIKSHKPFSVNLIGISYGPPKIIPPRMVWATGEKSKEFILLCAELEKALSTLSKIHFKPENKEIIPHITLARIKEWEWRKIEPDERPEVGEQINMSFEVKSIDLMESHLKRTGPEYTILKTYKL